MSKKWLIILCMLIMVGCTQKSTHEKTRDNTPYVAICKRGDKDIGNKLVTIDISNALDGYMIVIYHGTNSQVKFRIYNPNETDPYTYDLQPNENIFPLTGGNGNYKFVLYEHASANKYYLSYTTIASLKIKNDTTTYLYPNQYVNYNKKTKTVEFAAKLVKDAHSDLDVVTKVYNYCVKHIHYDENKSKLANNGQLAGYIPQIDEIMEKKVGICFDYAAVMACMLRSQHIPTRMLIGYANTPDGVIYHAWIGVYTKETGWIDNLIKFDGKNWSLMDPTIASEDPDSDIVKKFITDKSHYTEKYKY